MFGMIMLLLGGNGYGNAMNKDADVKNVKVIACLPFGGEMKYADYATSSFWQELSENGDVKIVDIDKVREAVATLHVDINNITGADVLKLCEFLKCDAVFKCSIKKVVVPFVIKEINAKVELIRPNSEDVIFFTEQSSGQLISMSFESLATDAARNAAKKFKLYLKKLYH